MSAKHPIVAVTGSTGAGLSTVRHVFKEIFQRLGIRPAIVHGDDPVGQPQDGLQAVLLG